ncbi:MAG: mannosylglucosylglycerate synthase, partial [Actinomycetota bacterium]|nr:mannosylglucosylglycerate synthase [Actinomycetota bacterium]
AAAVLPNRFDVRAPEGQRDATRAALGVAAGERLVLQPTRAIPRKNVPAGIALARKLRATYWITGAAELGYDDELVALLDGAGIPTIHGWPEGTDPDRIEDAYAAADLVVLPSTWEGFGNPAIESAIYRRPLAIGSYPVGAELRARGFRWFDVHAPVPIAHFLAAPDSRVLEDNRAVAVRHFNLDDLPTELEGNLSLPFSWARHPW